MRACPGSLRDGRPSGNIIRTGVGNPISNRKGGFLWGQHQRLDLRLDIPLWARIVYVIVMFAVALGLFSGQ